MPERKGYRMSDDMERFEEFPRPGQRDSLETRAANIAAELKRGSITAEEALAGFYTLNAEVPIPNEEDELVGQSVKQISEALSERIDRIKRDERLNAIHRNQELAASVEGLTNAVKEFEEAVDRVLKAAPKLNRALTRIAPYLNERKDDLRRKIPKEPKG